MDNISDHSVPDPTDRRYDLLSFLSLFCSVHQSATTDVWASQVLLDRFTPWLRNLTGAGSSFEVHIVETGVLQRGIHAPLPTKLFDGRENVALKRPIMTGDRTSEIDEYIWGSMAIEFRILSNPVLGRHPNIVKLLGNVWQSTDVEQTAFAPVLVLEAAYGNLKELYSSSGPGVKIYEAIGLFSDIASGLATLHKCGVIHGDLKPENILIFRNDDGSYMAKLADFGSAIILHDMQSSVRLSGGTEYWRAPEYNETLLMSEIAATEIYSFGLLMLDFFIPGVAQEAQKLLRDIAAEDSTSENAHELLQNLAYTLICDTYDIEELAHLIRQCLEVEPSARPQTMEDLLGHLHDFLGVVTENQENLEPADGNPPDGIDGSETPVSAKTLEPGILNMSGAIADALGKKSSTSETDSLEKLASQLLKADIPSLPMITHSLATMRLLPRPVLSEAIDELQHIARGDVDIHLQSVAAFQLAFALTCGLDTRSQAVTDLALDMLLHSAKTGHEQAQAIAGWMYEAFGRRFPISQVVEEGWLYRAINKGVPTARRRLRKLNLALYEEAVLELRHENGGIGKTLFKGQWPDVAELELAYIPLWRKGSVQVQPRLLHYLAATGLSEAVRLVLGQLKIDINEPGPQGATPLCLACRSGHLSVVKLLLDRGANPVIPDMQGTTPLHWLSSFRTDEVEEIARLLLQRGANIEARARPTDMYVTKDDITSHLGRHGGTPLLWAVADLNTPVVQVLLDVGADPWDKAGKELRGLNNWGNNAYLSPIHFAARGHMHEILSLLLRDSKTPEALNNDYRTLGAGDWAFGVLPLGWAVCYGGFGCFEAILWHGKKYKDSCRRTIQLLLDRGADPKQVTSRGHTAIELATQWGQAFSIEFLRRTLQGDQVPTDEDIHKCLLNALLQGHIANFDALMSAHFKGRDALRNNPVLLDSAARHSDNPYFIVSLLKTFTKVTQPLGTTIFETAVRPGNFTVARLLHERGLFDPTCTERFTLPDGAIKTDNPTVLGTFILNSAISNTSVRAVRFILSLLNDEDPDSSEPQPAFWAGPPGDQRMSALHLAALVPELRTDLTKGAEVINELLTKFHKPHHLNCIAVPKLRFTPLHLAVYLANIYAIEVLLDEEDIDYGLADEQGRTSMDLALFRVFESTDEEMIGHITAFLSQGMRESAAKVRRESTMKVIVLLMGKHLQSKKYLSIVTKESEVTVNVITPNNEGPTEADKRDKRLAQIKIPTDEATINRMRQSPFLRKLIDMPIGTVKFLKAFESEEAAAAAGHSVEESRLSDEFKAYLHIREPAPGH